MKKVFEIINKVSEQHPYKQAGNSDSYSQYNEGWSDACSTIEAELEKEESPDEVAMYEVDHPNHYNDYDVEVIEMMRKIWGDGAVKIFCKLNAFKYRMRAGHKDNTAQDLEKEFWYLHFMNYLEDDAQEEN